jgi:hypothetical protein
MTSFKPSSASPVDGWVTFWSTKFTGQPLSHASPRLQLWAKVIFLFSPMIHAPYPRVDADEKARADNLKRNVTSGPRQGFGKALDPRGLAKGAPDPLA